jgi:hypothetical protein
MKAIYKYPIPTKEKYIIELPKDAQIIRIEDVEGFFFLWAIVTPHEAIEEHPTEKRCLEFYKTGQPIETPLERLNYLGTCKLFIMQELCLYGFENTFETAKINAL